MQSGGSRGYLNRFCLLNRRQLLAYVVEQLERAGIPEARRQAEWLLLHALHIQRPELYAYPEAPVSEEVRARTIHLLQRRLQREPLQYIVGETEFMGLPIRVSPAVLIPRPETEEVVEEALHRIKDIPRPRVLDVGTGSGCIALAMKHFRPDAAVWACDIRRNTLEVARENARRLELPVHFFQADVLSEQFPMQVKPSFHLLISNPPYIPLKEAETLEPEVRLFEPHEALFSGEDPLRFYRALAYHGRQILEPEGWIVVELHPDYAEEVASLFRNTGYQDVTIRRDLAGHPRILFGRHEKPASS